MGDKVTGYKATYIRSDGRKSSEDCLLWVEGCMGCNETHQQGASRLCLYGYALPYNFCNLLNTLTRTTGRAQRTFCNQALYRTSCPSTYYHTRFILTIGRDINSKVNHTENSWIGKSWRAIAGTYCVAPKE